MSEIKINDLAKELAVHWTAIKDCCVSEGIPESVFEKKHNSKLSIGLAMSVRDWHVEGKIKDAAEPEKAKPASKAKTSKKKAGSEDTAEEDSSSVATAIASPPAAPRHEHPAKEKAPVAVPSSDPGTGQAATATPPAVSHTTPHAPVVETKPTHTKAEAATAAAAAPAHPAPPPPRKFVAPPPPPVLEDPTENHMKATPVKPSMPVHTPTAHATTAPPMRPSEAAKPAAPAPSTAPSRTANQAPAQQNVPRRPTDVMPAGPKLENRAPVRLSGPKVVRIEAADPVEAPRPRRITPGGPSSSGGTGAGSTGGVRGAARPATGREEDDRGRSPRRKGATVTPNSKRSTGAGIPERRRASADEWVGGNVFSEQDIAEREERLARAGGFLRKRRQDAKRPGTPGGQTHLETGELIVEMSAPFTIKDLSATTGVKAADIIKKLFLQGQAATINSGIDPLKAQEIMIDFEIDLRVVEKKSAEEAISTEFGGREATDLKPRGAVVTILGHVDHGKTSLLDKIRGATVAAGEAGGITQRTSAFSVPLTVNGEEKQIVFLDTPGHEAFTGMRARGATVTDVIVLVVSAPEGVMPQTIESINHAKAAKVPIVVALNKIDRPDATEAAIQKTLGQLAAAGVNPQEWGGDTEVVRVSATTGKGIPELLETLDLQATILELKADFAGHARGTVIESRIEEGRGAVANIIVQQGKLSVGDYVVMGPSFGRVRDITDDRGGKLKLVFPPMPVQVSGLDQLPEAGDKFFVVDSLRKAQDAAEQRRRRDREAQLAAPKVTLDTIFSTIADKEVKEIKIVLKAAEQGTVEVLQKQCERISTAEIKIVVLHAAVGGITENDVNLAEASNAIIIGFNVIPSGKARSTAENKGVEIRTYQVIYNIVDDLKAAAEGMLQPDLREEIIGHAEVRKVFRVTKVGSIAGCYITDGMVQRDAFIRVTRDGVVIENDRVLEQLKRVKDDAKEVRSGMECGMKIVGYDDIKEGDVLECYKKIEVKRTLGGN